MAVDQGSEEEDEGARIPFGLRRHMGGEYDYSRHLAEICKACLLLCVYFRVGCAILWVAYMCFLRVHAWDSW